MTLIGWLIVLEIIVGIGLIIWYANRAHKHAKHSPAEKALRLHLEELEAAAEKKKAPAKEKTSSKKEKKS